MIEAWFIYDIIDSEPNNYVRVFFEEPEDYYYNNPEYIVEHVAYSVLEKK